RWRSAASAAMDAFNQSKRLLRNRYTEMGSNPLFFSKFSSRYNESSAPCNVQPVPEVWQWRCPRGVGLPVVWGTHARARIRDAFSTRQARRPSQGLARRQTGLGKGADPVAAGFG